MIYRIFLFLIRVPLFSVASSAVVALAASGQTVVYPIDSMQRGTEIINTFNSLSHASGVQFPEIAIQTTMVNSAPPYTTYKYMNVGIIPYVQSITQTTYNTLLIISYITSKTTAQQQYIVLPTELVTALLYFPTLANQPLNNATPFNSTFSSGVLPFFSVDPKLRAVDIVSAVTQLKKNSPFNTGSNQVWIQTTLSGPYAPSGSVVNGLLKNVTAISASNSLIQIQFQPLNFQPQTIIVTPEQVQQIIYILNPNSP